MKVCFRCGIEKPLEEFYKHKQMADGHLNKCKKCNKQDSINQYNKKIVDTDWKLKEQKRGRVKYRKYRYHSNSTKGVRERWFNKFPEKRNASSKASSLPKKDGHVKHHWSYNEEHYKDIIYIKKELHNTFHRFMVYDLEQYMYRTIIDFKKYPKGILLDSKEMHESYMNYVLDTQDLE